jgi:uncharacterized protein (TIGR02757 family)
MRDPAATARATAKATAVVGRVALDGLYAKYNRREFVTPDPLETLYGYEDPMDREVAGLIASCLAYGRVGQIVRSVSCVLERMSGPGSFLMRCSDRSLRRRLAGFKHRFTTGAQMAAMLAGVRRVVSQHGSLQACFLKGLGPGDDTVVPAMCTFVAELTAGATGLRTFLLPSPADGSACKRLNLFLRWMVRRDDVDPGGWQGVPASKLVVPLDTHMHRICRALGLTSRKQADLRTALEATAGFRAIIPEDPVRYDFALTRMAIRPGTDLEAFLEQHRIPHAA